MAREPCYPRWADAGDKETRNLQDGKGQWRIVGPILCGSNANPVIEIPATNDLPVRNLSTTNGLPEHFVFDHYMFGVPGSKVIACRIGLPKPLKPGECSCALVWTRMIAHRGTVSYLDAFGNRRTARFKADFPCDIMAAYAPYASSEQELRRSMTSWTPPRPNK